MKKTLVVESPNINIESKGTKDFVPIPQSLMSLQSGLSFINWIDYRF
ncbi:MAG: hypothetical protein Q4C95_12920 [Planctomycetia bacterium]|nr:hypothetical protein [Planctomycetia bacterium]